jgi:hypothetical protein
MRDDRYKVLAACMMLLYPCGLVSANCATPKTSLVELYTSQGCSSCPPADAVLGELAARSDIIAIGLHVDYWDDLGWRDRFSDPEATLRQQRYVARLRLASAFTPQVVVDGRTSLIGSDKRRILSVLDSTCTATSINLAIVGGELIVSLPEMLPHADYDVNVVGYLSQAVTPVGRGENSGKTLKEFNIVRTLRRLGAWSGETRAFKTPLSSYPTDVDRIAVFLQRPNQGDVLNAAAIAVSLR